MLGNVGALFWLSYFPGGSASIISLKTHTPDSVYDSLSTVNNLTLLKCQLTPMQMNIFLGTGQITGRIKLEGQVGRTGLIGESNSKFQVWLVRCNESWQVLVPHNTTYKSVISIGLKDCILLYIFSLGQKNKLIY